MRLERFTCLVVAFFLTFQPQEAFAGDKAGIPQLTVEQILEKYVEAIGGRARISKVNSLLIKGTLEAGKTQGAVVIYRKAPDWWVSRFTDSEGRRTSSGFDGQTHWIQTPKPGMRISTRFRGSLPISASFEIRPYKKARLLGTKNVEKREAFVLQLEDEAMRWKHYVDVQTFLLLRVDSETALDYKGPKVGGSLLENEFSWTARTVTYYSDWREVDGLKVAFQKQTTDDLGRKTVTKISEFKLNVETDDLIFQPPPGSEKLPR